MGWPFFKYPVPPRPAPPPRLPCLLTEVFAFQWCDCVFESAIETVSLHATKAGAYRAMRERLTELAERERGDAIQYGRIVGKGHKPFQHQAWRVRRMEVQP